MSCNLSSKVAFVLLLLVAGALGETLSYGSKVEHKRLESFLSQGYNYVLEPVADADVAYVEITTEFELGCQVMVRLSQADLSTGTDSALTELHRSRDYISTPGNLTYVEAIDPRMNALLTIVPCRTGASNISVTVYAKKAVEQVEVTGSNIVKLPNNTAIRVKPADTSLTRLYVEPESWGTNFELYYETLLGGRRFIEAPNSAFYAGDCEVIDDDDSSGWLLFVPLDTTQSELNVDLTRYAISRGSGEGVFELNEGETLILSEPAAGIGIEAVHGGHVTAFATVLPVVGSTCPNVDPFGVGAVWTSEESPTHIFDLNDESTNEDWVIVITVTSQSSTHVPVSIVVRNKYTEVEQDTLRVGTAVHIPFTGEAMQVSVEIPPIAATSWYVLKVFGGGSTDLTTLEGFKVRLVPDKFIITAHSTTQFVRKLPILVLPLYGCEIPPGDGKYNLFIEPLFTEGSPAESVDWRFTAILEKHSPQKISIGDSLTDRVHSHTCKHYRFTNDKEGKQSVRLAVRGAPSFEYTLSINYADHGLPGFTSSDTSRNGGFGCLSKPLHFATWESTTPYLKLSSPCLLPYDDYFVSVCSSSSISTLDEFQLLTEYETPTIVELKYGQEVSGILGCNEKQIYHLPWVEKGYANLDFRLIDMGSQKYVIEHLGSISVSDHWTDDACQQNFLSVPVHSKHLMDHLPFYMMPDVSDAYITISAPSYQYSQGWKYAFSVTKNVVSEMSLIVDEPRVGTLTADKVVDFRYAFNKDNKYAIITVLASNNGGSSSTDKGLEVSFTPRESCESLGRCEPFTVTNVAHFYIPPCDDAHHDWVLRTGVIDSENFELLQKLQTVGYSISVEELNITEIEQETAVRFVVSGSRVMHGHWVNPSSDAVAVEIRATTSRPNAEFSLAFSNKEYHASRTCCLPDEETADHYLVSENGTLTGVIPAGSTELFITARGANDDSLTVLDIDLILTAFSEPSDGSTSISSYNTNVTYTVPKNKPVTLAFESIPDDAHYLAFTSFATDQVEVRVHVDSIETEPLAFFQLTETANIFRLPKCVYELLLDSGDGQLILEVYAPPSDDERIIRVNPIVGSSITYGGNSQVNASYSDWRLFKLTVPAADASTGIKKQFRVVAEAEDFSVGLVSYASWHSPPFDPDMMSCGKSDHQIITRGSGSVAFTLTHEDIHPNTSFFFFVATEGPETSVNVSVDLISTVSSVQTVVVNADNKTIDLPDGMCDVWVFLDTPSVENYEQLALLLSPAKADLKYQLYPSLDVEVAYNLPMLSSYTTIDGSLFKFNDFLGLAGFKYMSKYAVNIRRKTVTDGCEGDRSFEIAIMSSTTSVQLNTHLSLPKPTVNPSFVADFDYLELSEGSFFSWNIYTEPESDISVTTTFRNPSAAMLPELIDTLGIIPVKQTTDYQTAFGQGFNLQANIVSAEFNTIEVDFINFSFEKESAEAETAIELEGKRIGANQFYCVDVPRMTMVGGATVEGITEESQIFFNSLGYTGITEEEFGFSVRINAGTEQFFSHSQILNASASFSRTILNTTREICFMNRPISDADSKVKVTIHLVQTTYAETHVGNTPNVISFNMKDGVILYGQDYGLTNNYFSVFECSDSSFLPEKTAVGTWPLFVEPSGLDQEANCSYYYSPAVHYVLSDTNPVHHFEFGETRSYFFSFTISDPETFFIGGRPIGLEMVEDAKHNFGFFMLSFMTSMSDVVVSFNTTHPLSFAYDNTVTSGTFSTYIFLSAPDTLETGAVDIITESFPIYYSTDIQIGRPFGCFIPTSGFGDCMRTVAVLQPSHVLDDVSGYIVLAPGDSQTIAPRLENVTQCRIEVLPLAGSYIIDSIGEFANQSGYWDAVTYFADSPLVTLSVPDDSDVERTRLQYRTVCEDGVQTQIRECARQCAFDLNIGESLSEFTDLMVYTYDRTAEFQLGMSAYSRSKFTSGGRVRDMIGVDYKTFSDTSNTYLSFLLDPTYPTHDYFTSLDFVHIVVDRNIHYAGSIEMEQWVAGYASVNSLWVRSITVPESLTVPDHALFKFEFRNPEYIDEKRETLPLTHPSLVADFALDNDDSWYFTDTRNGFTVLDSDTDAVFIMARQFYQSRRVIRVYSTQRIPVSFEVKISLVTDHNSAFTLSANHDELNCLNDLTGTHYIRYDMDDIDFHQHYLRISFDESRSYSEGVSRMIGAYRAMPANNLADYFEAPIFDLTPGGKHEIHCGSGGVYYFAVIIPSIMQGLDVCFMVEKVDIQRHDYEVIAKVITQQQYFTYDYVAQFSRRWQAAHEELIFLISKPETVPAWADLRIDIDTGDDLGSSGFVDVYHDCMDTSEECIVNRIMTIPFETSLVIDIPDYDALDGNLYVKYPGVKRISLGAYLVDQTVDSVQDTEMTNPRSSIWTPPSIEVSVTDQWDLNNDVIWSLQFGSGMTFKIYDDVTYQEFSLEDFDQSIDTSNYQTQTIRLRKYMFLNRPEAVEGRAMNRYRLAITGDLHSDYSFKQTVETNAVVTHTFTADPTFEFDSYSGLTKHCFEIAAQSEDVETYYGIHFSSSKSDCSLQMWVEGQVGIQTSSCTTKILLPSRLDADFTDPIDMSNGGTLCFAASHDHFLSYHYSTINTLLEGVNVIAPKHTLSSDEYAAKAHSYQPFSIWALPVDANVLPWKLEFDGAKEAVILDDDGFRVDYPDLGSSGVFQNTMDFVLPGRRVLVAFGEFSGWSTDDLNVTLTFYKKSTVTSKPSCVGKRALSPFLSAEEVSARENEVTHRLLRLLSAYNMDDQDSFHYIPSEKCEAMLTEYSCLLSFPPVENGLLAQADASVANGLYQHCWQRDFMALDRNVEGILDFFSPMQVYHINVGSPSKSNGFSMIVIGIILACVVLLATATIFLVRRNKPQNDDDRIPLFEDEDAGSFE